MATTVTQARKAITNTGTAVALASAQEVLSLIIRAEGGNKNVIHIGSSTVTTADLTTRGVYLKPGELCPVDFGPCDLAEIYINGDTLDAVTYYAVYGTTTSGTTVVQATAANLNATVTSAGWTPSAELGVGTNIVKASAGILHGFLVETGGTNDITVQFYNHASTATTPITPSIVVAGGDNYGGALPIDVICSVGIVCVISGTNGIVTAYYA